jgi:hypothetical protein
MPRREARILTVRGEMFRFYLDDGVLHITRRHGTAEDVAIRTFFEGNSTWDAAHSRWETVTETHGLYWTRHADDRSVIVISCWKRGDE